MKPSSSASSPLRGNRDLSVIAAALCIVATACGHAELSITKVWPERIFYKPGEEVRVDVEVVNPDKAAASAQLKVELIRDLDTATSLSDAAIQVEPGATNRCSLAWKAQAWLGIEARATISRDGIRIATKSEYFTCARSVCQVYLPAPGVLGYGAVPTNHLTRQIEYDAPMRRSYYGNCMEESMWAPSDCDDLTPDVDRWWSGQTCYNEWKTGFLRLNEALAAYGIQILTYAKAGGCGLATEEFYRKHPKWATFDEGRPGIENYNTGYMDFVKTISPPKPDDGWHPVPGKPEEMEKAGYKGAAKYAPYTTGRELATAIWYDGNNRELISHHAKELGNSAKMLGLAGVRYDGEFFTTRHELLDGTWNGPPDFDHDAADVRMLQQLKSETLKIHPGYIFGYNTHVDFRWNVKTDSTPRAFREKCKDDGLIMQEELAFPGNATWKDFIEIVRHNADVTRYYGGHHMCFPFNRNPRNLYNYIVAYALHSHMPLTYAFHPQYDPNKTSCELPKFATRFAAFLWDDEVHRWQPSEGSIEVNATREVWWKQFTSVRPVPAPGKGTFFVLHLINAPDGKTTLGDNNEANAEVVPKSCFPSGPANDVVVRWKKPRGFKRAMLADVEKCDLRELKPERDGDWLVFRIPTIVHWSMLIVETDTKTPKMVWEASREEMNLKTPTAEELGIALPGAADRFHWQQTFQAENYYPSPIGITDLVKESDAKGGASVHTGASKIKKLPEGTQAEWLYYLSGPYIYPKVPGHYLATFRLKVADNTSDKPVVCLSVSHNIDFPIPGVPALRSKVFTLRGTDFKKPNTYQEFRVPFEHPDYGYHTPMCTWAGSGEVWYDQLHVELLKPWTNEELTNYYAPLAAPTNLQHAASSETRVMVVRGMWHDLYRIDEAVAKLGAPAKMNEAYTSRYATQDLVMKGFNLDWDSIYKQDVIILANVETRTIAYGRVKMLQKWIEDGGRLIVLGGILTLGQSYNMEIGWPTFLPVELNMPFEVQECKQPVQFGAVDKSLELSKATWNTPTALMYRHMVKAKPGATVLVAGKKGEPLLVGGSYGKGRVVVFTGTVLGEEPQGTTPFWNSPSWPDTLAAAVRWSQSK